MRDTSVSRRGESIAGVLLLGTAIAAQLLCLWWYGIDALPGHPRSDYEWYFYPQREFLGRWLSRGVFPWWNPHLFCGYPVLEIQQAGLFYPFNTLSLILLSARLSLYVLLSAHVFLAAVFTYITLSRCFHLSRLSSAFGASIYIWSAVFTHRYFAGHPSINFAMTWLPLAAGALATGITEVHNLSHVRWPWLVTSVVATTCIILAGAPQYVFFTFWAQVAIILAVTQTSWLVRCTGLCIVWLGALGTSAIQWLPSLVYIPLSSRASGDFLKLTAADTVLFELLFPYPLGDGRSTPHLQSRGVWDTSGYMGYGAVVLTMLSLLRLPEQRYRLPVRCGLLLILFSMYHVCGGWLPGFGSFREVARTVVLAEVGIVILAACTVDKMLSGWANRERQLLTDCRSRVAVVMLTGIPLCLLAYTLFRPEDAAALAFQLADLDFGSHEKIIQLSREIERNPWLAAGPIARASGFALGVSVVVGTAVCVRNGLRFAPVVVVVIICLTDLVYHHAGLVLPQVKPGETGWPLPVREKLVRFGKGNVEQKSGPSRVTIPQSMCNGAQLIEGVYETGGYDPLMPLLAMSRGSTFAQDTSVDRMMRKQQSLGLGGTVEELTPGDPPSEEIPQQARSYRLSQNSDPASIVEMTTTITLVTNDFIGDVRTAYADVSDREALASVLAPGSAYDVAESYSWKTPSTPNTMEVETRTSAPTLLIFKVTWLPGWQASINGKTSRAIRVNGWMIGVPVSAGESHVTLTYRPRFLKTGAAISLCTLVLCCGFLLLCSKVQNWRAREFVG